jgi:hypothetical protein
MIGVSASLIDLAVDESQEEIFLGLIINFYSWYG